MNRTLALTIAVSLVAAAAWPGCGLRPASFNFTPIQDIVHYDSIATHIDTPNVKPSPDDPVMASLSPEAVVQNGQVQYWDLKLEEAMQVSLARSKVLHDLGGTLLRTPSAIRTIHGPAIADTDPQYGVEAALSDYDAVFSSSADSQHNDRAVNNIFLGGGTRILKQDLDTFQTAITKETPTGTTFSLTNNTVYDHNNEPGNLFGSAWDVNFEFEGRQHLLQGAGTEYNEIAGPHGAPGQYNGVLIARINTDISLTDFEMGLRDLASNVENAYWDLYFAYRDLDAKIAARDEALESWRRTHALFLAGRRGGEAEKEAEAREQYFQFQEDVENAWSGRLIDSTETYNGSSGGTFRSVGGVRVAERRLRLLMGLPTTDCRLIRPADEPSLAKVVFCWEDILPEAITRRPELRRQRWTVKRRELELIASRNFLKPTLDGLALYRFRGFGQDLINSDPNVAEFNNAYGDLLDGHFQEWELGMELSIPIGERKGHAAVRNAQLMLARERAVLDDQERQVVHDLSNAISDLDRAYEVSQTAYNRRMAARAEVAATKAAYESDKVPLDLYLESQRRLADAESRFFAALAEYAVAVKNVHFEKGSLMDYNAIYLAEGPWPDKAYRDAATRKPARHQFANLNYVMKPGPVSNGPVEQGPPMGAGPIGPDAIGPESIGPGPMNSGPMNFGPMNQGPMQEQLPRGQQPAPPQGLGPSAAPRQAEPPTPPTVRLPPISMSPAQTQPAQMQPMQMQTMQTRSAQTQPTETDAAPTAAGQQRDLQPRFERALPPVLQPAQRSADPDQFRAFQAPASNPPAASYSAPKNSSPASYPPPSYISPDYPPPGKSSPASFITGTSPPAASGPVIVAPTQTTPTQTTPPQMAAPQLTAPQLPPPANSQPSGRWSTGPISIPSNTDSAMPARGPVAWPPSAPQSSGPSSFGPPTNILRQNPAPQANVPDSTLQPLPPVGNPERAPAAVAPIGTAPTGRESVWMQPDSRPAIVRPASYPAAIAPDAQPRPVAGAVRLLPPVGAAPASGLQPLPPLDNASRAPAWPTAGATSAVPQSGDSHPRLDLVAPSGDSHPRLDSATASLQPLPPVGPPANRAAPDPSAASLVPLPPTNPSLQPLPPVSRP